jgi:hypothetical protein
MQNIYQVRGYLRRRRDADRAPPVFPLHVLLSVQIKFMNFADYSTVLVGHPRLHIAM